MNHKILYLNRNVQCTYTLMKMTQFSYTLNLYVGAEAAPPRWWRWATGPQ